MTQRFNMLLLCCALALISPSSAFGIGITNAIGNGEEEKVAVPQPDPANLRPGWWEYFSESNPDKFAEKVSTIETALTSLANVVEPEQRTNYDTLLRRFLLNLRALPQARLRMPPTMPVSKPLQEQYTLDELVTIYEHWADAKAKLTEETEELQQLERSTSVASRELDNRLVSYMSLTANTEKKVLRGLEIMADRAALAVAREDLRVQQGRHKAATLEENQVATQLKGARDHLSTDAVAAERYLADQQQATENLERARSELLKAEARSLQILADTPEARAQSYRLEQAVRLAEARKIQQEVNLLLLRISEGIENLLQPRNDESHVNQSTDNLDQWTDQLELFEPLADNLLRASEREYRRASAAYREVTEQPAQAAPGLTLLSQQRVTMAEETINAVQGLMQDINKAQYLLSVGEELSYREATAVVRFSFTLWEAAKEALQSTWNILSMSLFKIGDVPVTLLGLIRVVLLILMFAAFSWVVQAALKRAAEQQWRIAKSTFYTLGRLAHYSLLSLGVIVALVSLGIDFSTLAIVAGALSLGIGFGLQTMVNNFLSGLIILFEKNLKIGDFLQLESGLSGYVSEINVRTTVIRTNDGIEVVIPNAEITDNKVTNWTMTDAYRRMHIPFGVAYGTEKEKVRDAVLIAADNVSHTLKDHVKYGDPSVRLVEFGDSSLNFELVVWVNARACRYPHRTRADYLWEIETQLTSAGVTIPFPQRDIYIKSMPEGVFSGRERDPQIP